MSVQNYRSTKQRAVILEELRKVNTHPSADEIYEKVRKVLPRVSLGTVYRNLETLALQGEIQKIEMGSSQKRFDGNPENHYHIRCSVCGRIVDAFLLTQLDIDQGFTLATDFVITGHRLEFVGVCPECQKKRSTPAPSA